ncbi:hypothetical protein I8751_05265 [Nostocaceae cyanobacterium CENA357]|uniref:Uncharacterized protein n=1 Tax=Atlanticothrix silvestris CENA357 TaxID=1725252 RepID=A0A8J7KX85_9CYAN|nr:hypothetical protein [Atlanticothrix silvestris]MBH8551795.1 hypothetical protein [Atlanticothrix silvestris CENA357]
MYKQQKPPNQVRIWGNIDFDKVKNRIDHVTYQIHQVLQKYEIPKQTGNSDQRNN